MAAIPAGITVNRFVVMIDKGLNVYQIGGISSVALNLPGVAVFQQAATIASSFFMVLASFKMISGRCRGR